MRLRPLATPVRITADDVALDGDLVVPAGATGLVLFAHGSGSSRLSPRNRAVADALNEAGLATLLADLLTPAEERADARTAHLRFDIGLLTRRLVGIVDWLECSDATRELAVGIFGASTGAAAAARAAVVRPDRVRAVVSRGGRVDLAIDECPLLIAPTLLIVGGDDTEVLALNQRALERIGASAKGLVVVPGAGHLFEEAGALGSVALSAATWFLEHLVRSDAERCTECGAPILGSACGSCAPGGRPLDKGERRREQAEAAREKVRWDQHLVERKRHERPSPHD